MKSETSLHHHPTFHLVLLKFLVVNEYFISRTSDNFPNIGISMMIGHLRSCNINVPRQRLRDSLVRLSPLSVFMRSLITVSRRCYNVPAPNSLWHIDGHHCLIRWRLVTHWGVDGFSRMIVFLHCSDNNCAVHAGLGLTKVWKM